MANITQKVDNFAKKKTKSPTSDNNAEKNEPGRLLEIIEPDRRLLDNIKYIELKNGALHPIEKAERQLEIMSVEFSDWLRDEIDYLVKCWRKLKQQPDEPEAFSEFSKALHVIKGNAEMLNNEKAGRLAATLSRLIERTCYIKEHIETIELIVQAINICAGRKDCKKFDEVKNGFEEIIEKKITALQI